MENIDTVKSFVKSLDASISNLSVALEPALSANIEEAVAKCLLPQEKIKIYHDHLYTTISIIFAYLKATGVNTDTHPIMEELDKIKRSINRFKQMESSQNKKIESEELAQKKAATFLQNALGTTGGQAAPDSLKKPAISSANFQGTHTKFT